MKTIHVKSEEKVRYNQGRSEYAFRMRYHRRFPWWCLLFLLLIPLLFIPLKLTERVYVKAGDGTPIEDACVNLTNTRYDMRMPWIKVEESTSHDEYTSSKGLAVFHVNATPLGMIMHAGLKSKAEATKGNLSATGVFNLHWKRKCTLILAGEMKIEVRSRRTNEPIPGATVALTVSDMEERKMALTTDDNGLASYTIHDPEGQIDTLLVTKHGYSGVREVHLAYESLDDLHHIVYLDPPQRCGWEAINEDRYHAEKTTVMDFDMGQVGGTARFGYWTEALPETIEVYDGTSGDYSAGTAKLLFRYDESSGTDDYLYENIHFSGQYICVVVQLTEGSWYWGYKIDCPY